MAVDKSYGSGKPLSVAESRNRRRKAAGLTIKPEFTGRMPDKKPGTINKPKPGFGINPPKKKPDYGIMPVPKPVGPKKPGRKTIMPVKPKRGM